MSELLARLRSAGRLGRLDAAFGAFALRLARSDDPALGLAAALAARATAGGSVCLDLAAVEPDLAAAAGTGDAAAWCRRLRAASVVGAPGERRPLILDEAGRLYLLRYFDYERRVAEALLARARSAADVDDGQLRAGLDRLFGDGGRRPDWQKVAAALAATRPLAVICGGPGTGKTTTVVRVLALLAELEPKLRVALAAPTGKAAARVSAAVRRARDALPVAPAAREAIPLEAATLHRLLGARPGSTRFVHHRGNPLAVDVLVVDEASMIDLALMARLLDALLPAARLILLGDRDQLASVEAGAVLGDVCGPASGFSDAYRERLEQLTGQALPEGGGAAGAAMVSRPDARPDDDARSEPPAERDEGVPPAPRSSPVPRTDDEGGSAAAGVLADAVVTLRHSYRFDAGGGIGRLAGLVRAGDADGALALLREAGDEVSLVEEGTAGRLAARVRSGLAAYLEAVERGDDAATVVAAFDRFRLLCAHRRGVAGVSGLNALVERELRASGVLRLDAAWYVGRPVMVTRNDHRLGLYNGDVGIVLADAEGRGQVNFESAGGIRRLAPPRLPSHETVFAMTVHKAQGSEFDDVVLALPAEPTPVLTRELLYTAVTRARRRVEIHGSAAVLRAAIGRLQRRGSGLRERLWSADGARGA